MRAYVSICMFSIVYGMTSVYVVIFMLLSRILNLYAEENAIDDAMYFLGEALRREAITLEVFLKVIHILCSNCLCIILNMELIEIDQLLLNSYKLHLVSCSLVFPLHAGFSLPYVSDDK